MRTTSLLSPPGGAGAGLPPRSRRRFLQGLSVAAVAVGVFPVVRWLACAQPEGGVTYVVEMRDFFFDPLGLNLRRGDTVTWIEAPEQARMAHTATAYHPDFDKVLRIPEGATAWSTGFFERADQSWSHTFEAVGIHDYFCIPHEDTGMVGRLLVEEASGPGTQPLDVGISAAGQSVMPFVEELQGPVGEVFGVQGRINAAMLPWRRRNQAEAVALWDALAIEWDGLLAQFLAQLSPADLNRVQGERDAFGAVVHSQASVFEALQRANGLKELLEQLAYEAG